MRKRKGQKKFNPDDPGFKRTYGIYRVAGKHWQLLNVSKGMLKAAGVRSYISDEGWMELEIRSNFEFEIMEGVVTAAGLRYKFQRPM